ncbi:hypothetical protein [Bacteroides sp. AM54-2NS]|nr:hypothetical protein [Bacteroides sp. AM54-2NS]
MLLIVLLPTLIQLRAIQATYQTEVSNGTSSLGRRNINQQLYDVGDAY